MITHAFGGIDPPKPLKPAAALVPHPSPTSPQSHAAATTTTSTTKSVTVAAEAGVKGTTRNPSPAPVHKVPSAGPRSTSSLPSPSSAKNDPHHPETSVGPQDTQALKTNSQSDGWQESISSETADQFYSSSKKAIDPSVQASSKEGRPYSTANNKLLNYLLDTFHLAALSSHQASNIKSALSSNSVVPNSLPTEEEKHEEGASRKMAETTGSLPSDKNPGQDRNPSIRNTPLHDGSLPQESRYPQGRSTAAPISPRTKNQLNNAIATENRDPPNPAQGNTDGASTSIKPGLLADPASEASSARKPGVTSDVRSSTRATLQKSSYKPLSNDHGEQETQTLSPDPKVSATLAFATMVFSKGFPEAKLDIPTSATVTLSNLISETKADTLTSISLKAFKGTSEMKPDALVHLPASTAIHSTSSFPGVLALDASKLKTDGTSESFDIAKFNSYHIEADGAVGSLAMPTSSPIDPFANEGIRTTTPQSSIVDAKYHTGDRGRTGVSVAPSSLTDAEHYFTTAGVVESGEVVSKHGSPPSLSVPSSSLDSVLAAAALVDDAQSTPSNSTKAVLGRQTTVGPTQYASRVDSADALPSLSIRSSDLHSNVNTVSDPQCQPLNSSKAVVANQTGTASKSSGTLTVGNQAQASSTSSNDLEGTTSVLPHKSGVERSARARLTDAFVCFASLCLLLIV